MKSTETHEWIDLKDGVGTVGLSDYAQKELGDIVCIELPQVGKTVKVGEEAAVLESTKAAADVYAPISGKVIAINTQLESRPDLINEDAFGDGWICRIKPDDLEELDELLDADAYLAMICETESDE